MPGVAFDSIGLGPSVSSRLSSGPCAEPSSAEPLRLPSGPSSGPSASGVPSVSTEPGPQ
jgi:hypothetical protein